MKQLLGLEQPRGEALGMMMPKESLQRLTVWLQTIGPKIMAHERTRFLQALLNKGQRHLSGRRIGKVSERHRLRPLEGFEHSRRQPRVLLGERAPHPDEMHDREYAGALIII